MIKKLLMLALVAFSIGTGTRSAQAQTFGGDIATIDQTHLQALWDVSVTKVSAFTWNVNVSYVSTYATAIGMPNLKDIQVSFLSNHNDPSSGFTTVSGSGGVSPGSNWLAAPTQFDPTVFEFNAKLPTMTKVSSLNGPFTGTITLDSSGGPLSVNGVEFIITGEHGSGTGTFPPAVTPEGASLLLLLPGLIPVAVGLRRRRTNKPAGE